SMGNSQKLYLKREEAGTGFLSIIGSERSQVHRPLSENRKQRNAPSWCPDTLFGKAWRSIARAASFASRICIGCFCMAGVPANVSASEPHSCARPSGQWIFGSASRRSYSRLLRSICSGSAGHFWDRQILGNRALDGQRDSGCSQRAERIGWRDDPGESGRRSRRHTPVVANSFNTRDRKHVHGFLSAHPESSAQAAAAGRF